MLSQFNNNNAGNTYSQMILKFLLSPSLESIWEGPHTVTLFAAQTVTKMPENIS